MLRGNLLNIATLRALGHVVSALLLCCALSGQAAAEERTLSMYNIHTKETLTVTYKKDGDFDSDGLKQINHMMRDWRRDESTKMDPELIDLIWRLHKELGSNEPVHLISGYRSSKTNERMRRNGGGQAKNSQHILGKAADIHFPDVPVKTLRNSALVHEVGGVGYYPRSGLPFVHVDTGRVRSWPRLPRQELAALFPSGKTEHLPSDGRPITLADSRIAIARNKHRAPDAPKRPETRIAEARDAQSREADRDPVAAPIAVETVVADASDEIAHQKKRTKELLALTAPSKSAPNIVTAGAGLGSLSLPWLARMSGLTPEIAPAGDPEPLVSAAKLQLASADLTAAIPDAADRRPEVEQAVVAAAPEYDPEHPEELNYQPFPILPLLTESDLAGDEMAIALEQPGHGEADYLLTTPYRGLELPLAPLTGVTRLALVREFTGPAVHDLLRPTDDSQKVLTASATDTPPPPLPAALAGPVPDAAPPAMGFAPIPR